MFYHLTGLVVGEEEKERRERREGGREEGREGGREGKEGGRERRERGREGGREGGIEGVKVSVSHQLTVEGFVGVSEFQLRSLNQIKINMIEM